MQKHGGGYICKSKEVEILVSVFNPEVPITGRACCPVCIKKIQKGEIK